MSGDDEALVTVSGCCHDARVTTRLPLPVEVGPVAVPYASWVRRAVAAVLDGAVLAGVTWYVAGDGYVAPPSLPALGEAASNGAPWGSSPALVGVWLLMLVAQGLTGQTPGRRVVGIAVVRAPRDGAVGGPPGVLRSVLRWFAHVLDAILLVGYLRPMWNPEHRTFADSLVGTVVVRRASGRDRTARVATVVSWALVVVGFAAGVPVGVSGGTRQGGTTPCVLEQQAAGTPVRDVLVDQEVESWYERRLLAWPRTPERRETTRTTVEVVREWHGTAAGGADDVVVRTAAPDGTTEHDLTLAGGRASLEVEHTGPGPVDVTVLWHDQVVASCTAPPAR